MNDQEKEDLEAWRRVKNGWCVCCGGDTEDFEAIGEGVKMCREYCITEEPLRDHRDTAELQLESVLRGRLLSQLGR